MPYKYVTVSWPCAPFFLPSLLFSNVDLFGRIATLSLMCAGSSHNCLQTACSFSAAIRSRGQGHISPTECSVLDPGCPAFHFELNGVSDATLVCNIWGSALICCHCLVRRNDNAYSPEITLIWQLHKSLNQVCRKTVLTCSHILVPAIDLYLP